MMTKTNLALASTFMGALALSQPAQAFYADEVEHIQVCTADFREVAFGYVLEGTPSNEANIQQVLSQTSNAIIDGKTFEELVGDQGFKTRADAAKEKAAQDLALQGGDYNIVYFSKTPHLTGDACAP